MIDPPMGEDMGDMDHSTMDMGEGLAVEACARPDLPQHGAEAGRGWLE